MFYYIQQLLSNPIVFWGLVVLGIIVAYNKLAPKLKIRVPTVDVPMTPDALIGKFVPAYAEAKAQREIEQLKKSGDFLTAGRRLEDGGKLDEAVASYTEGGEFFAAATLVEKMGKLERAGELYLQADDTKKAAQVFSQAGKHIRAAELFKEKGNNLEAARLYGVGGQWDKAAALYAKSGYPSRAGDAYEKCGELVKAAESYEKHFMENVSYATTYSSTATSPDQKSALLAGRLYEKAGDARRALEIYQKGSYFKEAAAACERLGQFAKAAELYMRAEDPGLAANAFEKGGDAVQAANLRGEVALKAGKTAEAAGFFLHGRDHLRSAELYESIGMLAEAAGSYEAADSHAAAGNVYVRAGLKEKAAAAYEKGNDWETAAKLYEEAGDTRKAIELFDRAGFTFKSGEAAAKAGDNERAISLLQRVTAGDENYGAATELLADVFIRTGRPLLAQERVQKVLAGQTIAANTLNLYFWLAAAQEASGRTDDALAIYKKIQAEDLHFRDVEARVGRLLAGGSSPNVGGGMPDKLGKYTLMAKIGQGAMGEVFRGHDPILKRDVAVKVISATLAPDSDMRVRFEREAQSVARLNHPNIITVYEAGQEQGRIYMAMELLDGTDLRGAINRNALPTLQQKLTVMEQIAEGLAYAHSREIVHRDLKPGNIHILPSGQAKILDFGLARLGSSEITQSGMIMGTPNYMSPEQVRGERADSRSDVFSVGAVFYELLSNRKAFEAESMQGVLYQVMNDEPEPVRKWVPDLPETLIAVIEKALLKDPGKRYRDGSELREALKPVRRTMPSSAVIKPGAAIPTPDPRPAEVRPAAAGPKFAPEAPTKPSVFKPTGPTPSAGAAPPTLVEADASVPVPPSLPPAKPLPPPLPPPSPSPAAPPPAGRGARFLPQGEIGRGPKGIVYRGGDASTDGSAVALRFLSADVLKADGALAALGTDLKAASGLVHPNLVKLIGFVEIGGQRCVVSELVPGKSFAEPLKAGKRVPFAHALGIARVMAEVLGTIHGRKLVHGGIQPSNLMAAGSVVKVADFGLGRVFQLTSGARAYWPHGGKFEAPTDLYAMAATLYHLLTGTNPRQAAELKPPSTLAAGIPPAFDALLLRALDADPSKRPASARAFLDGLGNLGARPPAS